MPAKLLHHHISSIRNCQYAHKQLEISKYHDSETWQKRKNVRRNTRKKYKKKKIILYSTTATAAHTQRSLVLPFAVSARTHTQHTRWVGRVFFVAELANVLRHRFSIFQWQLIAATIHYATSVATHSIYTVISWQISLELSKASELSLYFFHNINFFFSPRLSSALLTSHLCCAQMALDVCGRKSSANTHTNTHTHSILSTGMNGFDDDDNDIEIRTKTVYAASYSIHSYVSFSSTLYVRGVCVCWLVCLCPACGTRMRASKLHTIFVSFCSTMRAPVVRAKFESHHLIVAITIQLHKKSISFHWLIIEIHKYQVWTILFSLQNIFSRSSGVYKNAFKVHRLFGPFFIGQHFIRWILFLFSRFFEAINKRENH